MGMRFALSMFWVVVSVTASAQAADRPNIIVILADDFGVGDIRAHYPQNKIPTPYLDHLVRQGMSFTDAHSGSAVCSPTRYGLLTGRYSWRTRLQEWVIACYEPPLIAPDRLTLAGLLRETGYHTACIGKWHLGWEWPGPQPSRMEEVRNGLKTANWDFSQPILGGPTSRGFDQFFGVDLPNLPPFTFIEQDRVTTQPSDRYEFDPDEGVVMPRGFVGAPMAPGWEFDRILPVITQRAVEFIQQQAQKPEPFFLYFSQTSPHEPVVPSEDFVGASGIAPIADFVMETDWSAGQVIKAVDEAGIAEETIVIFTADNGHSHYTGWEALVGAGHLPSGPYRGHKGDVWEGGHRVPFIVRWPGQVTAGSSSDQLLCLNDVMATCAELLDSDLPENTAEDSFSFLSVLRGQPSAGLRTSVVSHSNHGEFAYREGPWKIVFKMSGRNLQESRGRKTIVELYNLETDQSEQHNVATARPELVDRLTANLQRLVDRGTSRPGGPQANDTDVRFDVTQARRWTAAAE